MPIALYGWMRHQGDFDGALKEVLNCGGDTDSVGAICGGLTALQANIPEAWIDRLTDWPISVGYLRDLADRMAGKPAKTSPMRWALNPVRNLFLLLVILAHAFRRLIR